MTLPLESNQGEGEVLGNRLTGTPCLPESCIGYRTRWYMPQCVLGCVVWCHNKTYQPYAALAKLQNGRNILQVNMTILLAELPGDTLITGIHNGALRPARNSRCTTRTG